METTKIKVIVSDGKMVGMSGSELLAEVWRRFPHTLRILLSGNTTPEMAMRAVNEGQVYRFLTKPWNDNMLRLALSTATEKYNSDAERRHLLDSLLQSEERYRTLFSRASEGIFIMTTDGKLKDVNESYARMHGYSADEMKQMNLADLNTEGTAQPATARMERICAGETLTFEVEHYHRDGHRFSIEVTASLISVNGENCIQCFHRDITERKRTEEALQESHDLLELRVVERTRELWHSNETLRAEITTRKRAEKALKAQTHQLEETNTALKVLLHHREEELREVEKKVVANIQKLVLPYIGELKQLRLSPGQSSYVELIDANLQQVIDPFLQNLAARFSVLTPREIQIASLIKEGKTNKEIAVFLKVNPRSVEFHRNNIRKKMGLSGKKTNLSSFLLTLS